MTILTISLVASSAGLVGGAIGVALGTALFKLWEHFHPRASIWEHHHYHASQEWPSDVSRDFDPPF